VFTGCQFQDGGKATSGTYNGLTLGANCDDIIVSGCWFSLHGAVNNYKYGIQVASGSNRILVNGNTIYHAQTKAINWLNTDSNSRCKNNGDTNTLRSDHDSYILPIGKDFTSGNVTLSGVETLCTVLTASNVGVARDCTTASAANIVTALQNPCLGTGIPLTVINTGGATLTLVAGSGVTANGNTSAAGKFEITTLQTRHFWFRVTNLGSGTETLDIYG